MTAEGAGTEAAGRDASTAGVEGAEGVDVAEEGSTVRGEGTGRAWAGMVEGGLPFVSSAPEAGSCMRRGRGLVGSGEEGRRGGEGRWRLLRVMAWK